MSRHISVIPVAFVASWTTLVLPVVAEAIGAADSAGVAHPPTVAAAPDSDRLAALRADLGARRVHQSDSTASLTRASAR